MRVQGVQSTMSLIRPVILAASRQRRLWPLSTPETPFCLRSINSRPAFLIRTLQALEANSAFGPPIVILAESAARLGIAEITRVRPDAQIILVPSVVGSGIASLIAAIEVANSCASEQIALIPGSFFATDPVEALGSLAAVASQFSGADQVVLMAGRSNVSHAGLSIELGTRIENSSLFTLKQLHQNVSSVMTSVLRETNSLINTSGPALVSTQSLLKHIQSNFPTTYVACHNALKLAEKYGNTFRPQRDFLSLAGTPSIHNYFQSVLPSMRAYIGNSDWRTIETFRDQLFDEYQTIPITPVAIAGPKDQKIIASNDGVLILKAGFEDAVKDLYPNISASQASGTNAHQKGPSLRFTA
jgi:mannose-1-phosphate guanylyltransferase